LPAGGAYRLPAALAHFMTKPVQRRVAFKKERGNGG
jgi:hypothetical protein